MGIIGRLLAFALVTFIMLIPGINGHAKSFDIEVYEDVYITYGDKETEIAVLPDEDIYNVKLYKVDAQNRKVKARSFAADVKVKDGKVVLTPNKAETVYIEINRDTSLEDTVGFVCQIHKAPLKVKIRNAVREFRQSNEDVIRDVQSHMSFEGFVNQDSKYVLNGKAIPQVVVSVGGLEGSTEHIQEDAISADLKTANIADNAPENYIYVSYEDGNTEKVYSDLKITGETISYFCKYISIDGNNVYQKLGNSGLRTETVFYGRNAKALFCINDSEQIYTKLIENDTGINVSRDGLQLSDEREDIILRNQTRTFHLENNDGSIRSKDFYLSFLADDQMPEVHLAADGTVLTLHNHLEDDIVYTIFKNKEISVVTSVNDQISGVAGNLEYALVNCSNMSFYAYKDYVNDLNYIKVPDSGQIQVPWEKEVLEGKYILFVKATDNVGNEVFYGSDGIIIDTVPAGQVKISHKDSGNYIQNDEAISMTVGDEGSIYSGIATINYSVSIDGIKTTYTYLPFGNGKLPAVSAKDMSRYKTASVLEGNQKPVIVSIDDGRSAIIDIWAYATDFAGNMPAQENMGYHTFIIDKKAPEIETKLTSDTGNGNYYRSDVIIQIVISERFLDMDNDLIFDINGKQRTLKALKENYKSFGIRKLTINYGEAEGERTDDSVSSVIIAFEKNDEYTVSVSVKDKAGNTARQDIERFVIDKEAPQISVSYDDTKDDGCFYNTARTAVVTVNERYFSVDDTHISISGEYGKQPVIERWVSDGNNNIAIVHFNESGSYTLSVSCRDIAGNTAIEYIGESFVVDLIKPELIISGIKDKSANKDIVAPVITVSDLNYESGNTKVVLTGANQKEINIEHMVSIVSERGHETISFNNFADDMDGIYTLMVETKDLAENIATASVIFSVNRHGSSYIFDSEIEQLGSLGVTGEPKDIVIEEINVDTLEFVELTYSKDGDIVALKNGQDYTVEVETIDGGWKKYKYTIKASCFWQEGLYSIQIYSEDRAKNVTTNRLKGKSLEFAIDKTAPVMAVSNLKNRGRYQEDTHRFTVSVKDNTAMEYINLYINGSLVKVYDGDTLGINDGMIEIQLDGSHAYQNVRLVACDIAGNQVTQDYEVLITASRLVQFYNNSILLIATLIVIVAAAVIIYNIFIYKHRSLMLQ